MAAAIDQRRTLGTTNADKLATRLSSDRRVPIDRLFSSRNMLELAYKALDILLAAFGGLRRISVRVHMAARVTDGQIAYFVKIVNLSRDRDVEVTHVWLDSEPILPLLNPDRPLPVRLAPDQIWETWVALTRIPIPLLSDVPTLVRAQLSNGAIFKSKLNKNVPSLGYIAGGRITDVGGRVDSSETEKEALPEQRLTSDTSPLTPQELEILQMFVEQPDRHTVDDIVKRFEITQHKAQYYLDQLQDRRLLGQSSKYRNAKPIYFITRPGRDLLVKEGRL